VPSACIPSLRTEQVVCRGIDRSAGPGVPRQAAMSGIRNRTCASVGSARSWQGSPSPGQLSIPSWR
jgi:hypothetical protein